MKKNEKNNPSAKSDSQSADSGIPFELSDKQKELCRRLDHFYKIALDNKGISPSSIYRGALYAISPEQTRQNPDWMAQAAHSLREIIYPFYKSSAVAVIKKGKAFKRYGSVGAVDKLTEVIDHYYGFLSDVAHHNLVHAASNKIIGGNKKNSVEITGEVLKEIVSGFEDVLFEALRRQLDAHGEIDAFIEKGLQDYGALIRLINLNDDARHYFYAATDEKWLEWLWQSGLLDPIKEKSVDPTKYYYHTPELEYLAKVALKVPEKVSDIILAITISEEHFNPEVLDRFLWICQSMPAAQLARIVPKIKNENWIRLMDKFNYAGFEYNKMLETLTEAHDYLSFLILSEAVLAIRPREELIKTGRSIADFRLFYFKELVDTKIFELLSNIDNKYLEQALKLTTIVFSNIVKLGEGKKDSTNSIFDLIDLYDFDFFSEHYDESPHLLHRNEMRKLAIVMKKLAQKTIGSKCEEPETANHIYNAYIRNLPENELTWRFQLLVMSLCPIAFQSDLRAAFFKIFDNEDYLRLLRWPEYEWTLKKCFSILPEEDQRSYVKRVISLFGSADKEGWIKHLGYNLLSCIYEWLEEPEIKDAQKVFGKALNSVYQPRASISDIKGGWVSPKAPIDQEELSKMPIMEIVGKLKNEWEPKKIKKQDQIKDILSPLNAEGMSKAIESDIEHRFQEYLSESALFFDRNQLDPHYTYALLNGIFDVIRKKKCPANIDWSGMIELLANIVDSGKALEFNHGPREREHHDAWLQSWEAVHDAMADVLQATIDGLSPEDFRKQRSNLINISEYLLKHPDPTPETENEKIKEIERDPQTGDEKSIGSDPLTIAINSVRGRAFQAFVKFVEKDGETKQKTTIPILSPDVKKIFIDCLHKENTRAVMFLFGQYLPFFFYQDREWIRSIVPGIFSDDPKRKNLYLAAWEGYLVQNLYLEFFNELADYYKKAIKLDPTEYTSRKYFKNLDTGLANHIALAFVHISEFGFSSELFRLFWDKNIPARHKEFISFIGRYCISRDKAKEWNANKKIDIEKLKQLWDWTLKNNNNSDVLIGFDLWMDAEKEIFDIPWLAKHIRDSLEKINGKMEWDHSLTQSFSILAKNAPFETLHILRIYFMGSEGVRKRRSWYYVDDSLLDVFKTLYKNTVTKDETDALINELLPLDNGRYWKLKDILD
jgi:hypothetical protein